MSTFESGSNLAGIKMFEDKVPWPWGKYASLGIGASLGVIATVLITFVDFRIGLIATDFYAIVEVVTILVMLVLLAVKNLRWVGVGLLLYILLYLIISFELVYRSGQL